MRSHTPDRPSRPGRRTMVVAASGVGLSIAVLVLALRFWAPSPTPESVDELSGAPSFGEAPLSDTALIAGLTSDTAATENPVYRHSVVAGGVHAVDDVRRVVSADPVVRAHYASVSVEKLKVVAAPARRDAYMSYRIGDRVYWTSKKIALAAGEAVLTDGETTIRARCGNLLSDQAMSPTSDQEPPASAFDAIEPRPGALPVASSEDLTALAGDLLARSGGGASTAFPGLAPGTFSENGPGSWQQGVGGFSSGNIGGSAGSVGGGGSGRPGQSGGSSDSALTSETPGGGPGEGNPGEENPGGGNPGGKPGEENPGGGGPGGDNPPGFEEPPGFPPTDFNPPGFGGDPTPGGPGNPGGPEVPPGFGPENPPITTEQVPPETVPVPEPASLLLFGSGLAITAWRARRHHARSKKSPE